MSPATRVAGDLAACLTITTSSSFALDRGHSPLTSNPTVSPSSGSPDPEVTTPLSGGGYLSQQSSLSSSVSRAESVASSIGEVDGGIVEASNCKSPLRPCCTAETERAARRTRGIELVGLECDAPSLDVASATLFIDADLADVNEPSGDEMLSSGEAEDVEKHDDLLAHFSKVRCPRLEAGVHCLPPICTSHSNMRVA